ncbi:MAG: radical SAM family heme chaperone HemW [Myxococcales bacterium]|nr:radical SAM family heme chaperone HemW [Myxococcales bacterium]
MISTALPSVFPELDHPPADIEDAAIYVHFPYCAHKCSYCDFNSHAIAHEDKLYADAIIQEFDQRSHLLPTPKGVSSIYFGGGTPSRWAPSQVERVIQHLHASVPINHGAELTLEVNPESATVERLEQYRQAGINRFSIGCQSFSSEYLTQLGRTHSAENARTVVQAARSTGAYVSLDLIYGLPEQSDDGALRDLHQGIALDPHHISAYTLTIEPETVLARRVRLGTFRPMPDDDQAHLIEMVSEELMKAGYHRYEVSSYAKRGYVARHNSLYWLGGYYLGLGAGAHSYLPENEANQTIVAYRQGNERAPDRYIAKALNHDAIHQFQEPIALRTALAERVMLVFRSAYGLNMEHWLQRTSTHLNVDVFTHALENLRANGLLTREGSWWRPTTKGFLYNDFIAVTMLQAIDDAFVQM